eukprot:XP_001695561.1 predicted protein [Chlamydomonas reinhardtii]
MVAVAEGPRWVPHRLDGGATYTTLDATAKYERQEAVVSSRQMLQAAPVYPPPAVTEPGGGDFEAFVPPDGEDETACSAVWNVDTNTNPFTTMCGDFTPGGDAIRMLNEMSVDDWSQFFYFLRGDDPCARKLAGMTSVVYFEPLPASCFAHEPIVSPACALDAPPCRNVTSSRSSPTPAYSATSIFATQGKAMSVMNAVQANMSAFVLAVAVGCGGNVLTASTDTISFFLCGGGATGGSNLAAEPDRLFSPAFRAIYNVSTVTAFVVAMPPLAPQQQARLPPPGDAQGETLISPPPPAVIPPPVASASSANVAPIVVAAVVPAVARHLDRAMAELMAVEVEGEVHVDSGGPDGSGGSADSMGLRGIRPIATQEGSMLVTHDDRFQIENVKRHDTPGFPSVAWHLPVRGSTFPDALAGYMPDFLVKMRPASKVEPTPPLRHPTWSNCTLPMILLSDYPYNMKSFMVRVVSDVDSLLRVKGLVPDRKATLVLATPSGLDLEPWHAGLLAPFAEGQPAAWSGEGIRVHCFAQVLKVIIEERTGMGWRTLRNVAEIIRACEQLNAADDAVRFFAYNVEDPAQCSPPDYGQTLSRATQSGPLPQHGHPLQPRNPPRYSPEQLLARDQHVTLRTAPLLEMIKHAAALLPDKSAYQQARNAGRTHGYAVKEGLLLAPGGQTDVAALQSSRVFAYQQSPQRAPAAGDDSDDAQAAALCRRVDSEGGAGTLRAVRGTSRLRLMHHQANGGASSDVGGGALPKAQVAAAAGFSTGSAACDDGDEVNSPAAAGAAVFTGVPPSVPAVGLLGDGSLLVVRSTAGILPGVSGAPPAAFGGARWSVLPVTPEAAAACWRKSPVFRPLSVSRPHHLTFHVAGLGGCLTFLAAFAPAALEPVMKDSLGLERSDLHAASLATLAAALAMQFVMAAVVAVLLGLAPVLACMALLTAGRRAELFVLLRLLLGAGLSLGVVTSFFVLSGLCLAAAVLTLLLGQDCPHGDILDPKPLPARGVLLLEGGALGGGGGGIKMGVGRAAIGAAAAGRGAPLAIPTSAAGLLMNGLRTASGGGAAAHIAATGPGCVAAAAAALAIPTGPGGAPSTATSSSKPPPSAAGLGDQQPPFGAYLVSVCSGSSTRGCATATGGSSSGSSRDRSSGAHSHLLLPPDSTRSASLRSTGGGFELPQLLPPPSNVARPTPVGVTSAAALAAAADDLLLAAVRRDASVGGGGAPAPATDVTAAAEGFAAGTAAAGPLDSTSGGALSAATGTSDEARRCDDGGRLPSAHTVPDVLLLAPSVECHDDNDAAELARAVDEGRRTYTRAHRTAAVVAAEAADVHAVMSAVLSAAETGSKALPNSVGVDQIDSSSGRLGSKVFRALLSNVSSVGASTAATAPLAGRLRLSNDFSGQPQRAERRTPFIRPSFVAGSSIDASSGGRRSMGGRWRWKPAAMALPVPVAEFALGGEKGGDGGGRQLHAESQPQQQEPQEPPTRSRIQRLSLRLLPSQYVAQSQQLGLPAAWASSSTGKRSRAAVDCSKAVGAEGLVDVEAPEAASTVVVGGDIMPQQHDEGPSGCNGGIVAAAMPQRAASSGAATAVVGAVEAPSPWGTAAVACLFGVMPSPQGGRAGIPSEMPASPAAGAAARSMGAAGVAGAGGDCVELGGASETYSSQQGSCYLRHSSKRQVTATSFRAGLAQNAVSGVTDAVTGSGGGAATVWHYVGDDRNEGGSEEEDAGAAAAAVLSDGVDGGAGGMLGGGEVMGAAGDGEVADARWAGSGTGGGGGLLDALRMLRTPACLLLAISNGFVTGCTLVCFNMLPSFYNEWVGMNGDRDFTLGARHARPYRVLGGGCCMVVGLVAHRSLPACVLLLLVMAAAVQGACGVLYTITPFVSFRHAAAVTAAVSAGGYVGAVVLQAACFLAVAPITRIIRKHVRPPVLKLVHKQIEGVAKLQSRWRNVILDVLVKITASTVTVEWYLLTLPPFCWFGGLSGAVGAMAVVQCMAVLEEAYRGEIEYGAPSMHTWCAFIMPAYSALAAAQEAVKAVLLAVLPRLFGLAPRALRRAWQPWAVHPSGCWRPAPQERAEVVATVEAVSCDGAVKSSSAGKGAAADGSGASGLKSRGLGQAKGHAGGDSGKAASAAPSDAPGKSKAERALARGAALVEAGVLMKTPKLPYDVDFSRKFLNYGIVVYAAIELRYFVWQLVGIEST